MVNLLSTSDQRKLKFAEILSNTEDWMTLTELSKLLNCSTRVLKDDIAYFRKNFTDFEIKGSNKGIRIFSTPNTGIKSLYQKMLSESTAYQLLETIFLQKGDTIADLSELLFVSGSTLYRLIRQINSEISKYGFKIDQSPYRLIGDEKNIRYFFYQYFYEKYSFMSWPFDSIDEEALDKFLIFHIEMTQLKNDFAYYSKFKIIIVVNLIRFKNNHYVDTKNIELNYESGIPDLGPYADLFREFEQAIDIKYDDQAIKQLFTSYVDNNFSVNYDHLMKRASENKEIAAEVSKIEQILERISEENNIPIPNKKQMISAIRNIIHLDYLEPRPGYILYNQDKYFVEGIQADFPNFYHSIQQAMKELRTFLGKPLTEEGINFYIYTVFTYWRGLVAELRKKFKKIRVIIISDRHETHAKMLKQFIAHEFTQQIVIDIYSKAALDEMTLESLSCDFIVTSFPIPKLNTKRTVYIETVPNFNDLVKLQRVIDDIIAQRIAEKNTP